MNAKKRSRVAQAARLLSPHLTGRDVLEIACGTADFSLAAAETARSVTAIDLDDCRLSPAARSTDGVRFQRMDAAAMTFPDGSFDAVISNYVYHNIMGADKQALLLESLRVLKKGGVFVLHDNMKPQMYGDMHAFAEKLKHMGFDQVEYVETAASIFGSKRRAAMMMLGDSAMIVGRK